MNRGNNNNVSTGGNDIPVDSEFDIDDQLLALSEATGLVAQYVLTDVDNELLALADDVNDSPLSTDESLIVVDKHNICEVCDDLLEDLLPVSHNGLPVMNVPSGNVPSSDSPVVLVTGDSSVVDNTQVSPVEKPVEPTLKY